MKLIVGLGNPGDEHALNRHNVGFMAVDRIAHVHGFPAWRKKFQALASEGELAGEKCLLLKPQTYMNESGRSVGEAVRFLKLDIGDVIVIYDEIDLAPGRIKVKTGGGNAGHNGLRSISAHLDNDYQRVRIGVGHPGSKDAVAHYVLNDFAKSERDWVAAMLDAIAEAAPFLAKGDPSRFLTKVALLLGEADTQEAPAKMTAGPPKAKPATLAKVRAPEPKSAGGALADKLKSWLKGEKP
ncbi:MAG: aminoacyl-tRNA hydrolase [Hyphomicrobiaceae bacterium]